MNEKCMYISLYDLALANRCVMPSQTKPFRSQRKRFSINKSLFSISMWTEIKETTEKFVVCYDLSFDLFI